MSFTRIYAIFLRYLYLVRDNPTRLFQMFVWGGIDVILWGFITRHLTEIAGSIHQFAPTLLGAVLLYGFLSRATQGVFMPFFEDVWSRNLLNIFASPISKVEYMLGFIASSISSGAMVFTVLALAASLFFGFSVLVYGISIVFFLIILFLFGAAIGIVAITIVLRFGPSTEWLAWPIPWIIAPFVGVFYPIATLPAWMQSVSPFLPPSYVFEGIRKILSGATFPLSDFIIGAGEAIAYIAAAYIVFLAVYRKAIQTGLIARYSAENV